MTVPNVKTDNPGIILQQYSPTNLVVTLTVDIYGTMPVSTDGVSR